MRPGQGPAHIVSPRQLDSSGQERSSLREFLGVAADGIDGGRWFGTEGSREKGSGGRNQRLLGWGDSFIPASVTRLKLVTGKICS